MAYAFRMLNIVIKRLAFAVALLWCVAMLILVSTTGHSIVGGTLILGGLPAAALIGAAYILCWVLGPIGRWGRNDNEFTYEIIEPRR